MRAFSTSLSFFVFVLQSLNLCSVVCSTRQAELFGVKPEKVAVGFLCPTLCRWGNMIILRRRLVPHLRECIFDLFGTSES